MGTTVVATGLALLYCVVLFPAMHQGRTWYVPNDAPQVLNAGLALIHGHLGQVYSGDRELYALPLSFPYTGLIALVLSWHNLIHINPPYWVLVGVPLFMAPGAVVLQQTRRLAWELGMRRRLWVAQAVAAFMVLVPLVEWGHVEDVMALGALLVAVRRLIMARYLQACLWLSVAISFKQWAVMLIPLFVWSSPAGQRFRSLASACALPGVLASVFLLMSFHSALTAFLSPVTQVGGFPGHPWIAGTWLGPHSSQANRLGATALACLLAWRRRRATADPSDLLASVALILMVRPLTETINYAYYWTPGLLLIAVLLLADGGPSWENWIWPAAVMAWTLPRSNDLTALDWWAGEIVLLAVTAWRARRLLSTGESRFDSFIESLDRPQPAEVAG